jgi:hypothetical protein
VECGLIYWVAFLVIWNVYALGIENFMEFRDFLESTINIELLQKSIIRVA